MKNLRACGVRAALQMPLSGGSINVIFDQSKTKVFEQSFDAWGRERNPNDWTYTANSSLPTPYWLIRGYTGHEHHRQFGLVNMNGRMYDPLVGRMLSPDNYVQATDFTQSFNRYSYCFNNPLKYTDPSGEIAWFVPVIIGAVAGAEIGGAWASGWKNWNPLNWSSKEWKGAGIGAMVGAGVGLGVSWGLSAAGAKVSGIYATYGLTGGATTTAWNITSNALITANINMASSWMQGRDETETLLSGASGLVAGAIGGYIGGRYNGSFGFSQKAIRATNYYTATINGTLDRFTNSVYNGESRDQVITNTFFGAAEGLYSGYLGNRNAITSLSVNKIKGFAGRYISSAISQSITSVPGLGLTAASYHLTGLAWKNTFVSDVAGWGALTLPPPGGPLYLGWLINTQLYSSAVINPLFLPR